MTPAWISLILGGLLVAQIGEPREVTLRGRVVTLQSVLAEAQIAVEPDRVAGQVVLRAQDGSIVPLLCNVASRALFDDDRLRDRTTEIKALQRAGLPFVEVVLFRVEQEGTLRVPEYWCEVCAISVRYPQICPCCQGDLELRYKPDDAGT